MYALTNKFLFLLMVIIIFTLLYWFLVSDAENWNNRGFDNNLTLFDCSYFVIITFSTIGYGDLSPKSNTARILTMILTIVVIIGLMDIFAELMLLNYKKIDLDDAISSIRPGYNNANRSTKVELATQILLDNSNKRDILAREILLNS